jgi:hypothetical protein
VGSCHGVHSGKTFAECHRQGAIRHDLHQRCQTPVYAILRTILRAFSIQFRKSRSSQGSFSQSTAGFFHFFAMHSFAGF